MAEQTTTKLIPRPYQIEGISFLRERHRALLFDDPGMGKTLQAAMAAEKPVLVACPTYLVEQWADFIKEQFPNDTVVYAYEGTQAQRLKALNQVQNPDWCIVNIEMLRTYNFHIVRTFIIDESHHVRNRNAQQSKAALEIAQVSKNVYLLTGSPIYKEVDDLYHQLRIIAPLAFKSYHQFVDTYCSTVSGPWGRKVVGAKYPTIVRKLLERYALGRSYKDVGLQLPDLIEQDIRIKMSHNMAEMYKRMRDHYRLLNITFSNAGSLLHALRMTTLCKEKLDAARELLDDNKNSRTVVFCWYRMTAEELGKELKAPVITGEMDVADRVKVAKGNHHTVVATLASLSEGVDLSRYKMLLFFEEDYTPGMMYQALSRVRRYSNDNDPVRAYYLMMRNTVDETIHKRRYNRNISAEEILGEAINGN